MLESKFPTFYKFFTADTCTTELELPPHVQLDLPKSVSIRDMYLNIWPIYARRVRGSWYFLNGWETFVNDNSLTKYDMLRFQYTREGLFDVKVYGLSGCEKEGVGYNKQDVITPDVTPADNSEQPRCKRKRVNWLGEDIFGEEFPRPEGLYFVRKFGAHRKNELYIPRELSHDRNLQLPSKMKLIDPAGRTYTTKFTQWSDTRSFYKGGWVQLLRANHIQEDDICICHFDHPTRPKHILVSFNKEPSP